MVTFSPASGLQVEEVLDGSETGHEHVSL